MQSLRSRSASSGMAQKNSPSSPNSKTSPSKSSNGGPASLDSSVSKSSKVLDRKPSTKAASLPEKRNVKVSEMPQQLSRLQEELKKEKEEKSRAVQALAEMKKRMPSQMNGDESRVEMLEKEVEKAKASERKMLESLVSQTKQLEQTKISLEEAKLEIRSLQESIKSLEGSAVSARRSSRHLGKHLEKNGPSDVVRAEEEIGKLRNELKLAMEAEEKSKRAMDDLAIALKEVTLEANQVKERFSKTKSELEDVRAEAERLKPLLESMEEKYRLASEESERLKLELEESTAAWNVKENGFVGCMKMSEEEITKLQQENSKLSDSQRVVREENFKLRDILKQSVSEATVVKEALEIARNENSQLKDLLLEKETAFQSIRQEYECLKVSEAAALDSVKVLKALLAATSTLDSSKTITLPETGSFAQLKESINDSKSMKGIFRFPSGRWKGESSRFQNSRRHSIGEPAKFKGSVFHMAGSPEQKDRMFASLSNVSDMRVASSIVMDDTLNSDDSDHLDGIQLDGMEHPSVKQKKKKAILRRFGDLLRIKTSHK
ncbi:uncharacterized protein [Elaeis guineensis]|uniref:WEB family protein At3g02930, chloroplastic n=1 Tax=Elaeis guineensis var. tenera TaxID=51953 RepID=A0A6I9S9M0_ELAGV|nr:WEB family protein At3g02930, chloroplastic [Elaeis guineensis]XP_029124304.1 WEB family protein At3g02930, chloroplastic [Elaeis guineensis]